MSWIIAVSLVVVVLSLVGLVLGWKRLATAWRILLGLLLAAGLFFAGASWLRARKAVDPLVGGEVVAVTRGPIAEVVEATGNLSPAAQVTLSFTTQGTLLELLVHTGSPVVRGQPLARLDTRDLELQVAQAKASLDAARANLEKVLSAARPEDVRAARASLDQAQANLEELRVTLATSVEQARLSWIQAANNLRDAQAHYSQVYWDNRELEDRLEKIGKSLPQENVDAEAQAWRAVENAQASMEQARLSYEQALQRQETSLRSAQAQVDAARANLERLIAGSTSAEIAALQAAVAQAQAAYEQAQLQLAKATLTAPFAGVVGDVFVQPYNQVTVASPILVLLDPSSYSVDVEVDEVDISKVAVGQEAQVKVDALPEVEIAARVTEIALSPTTGQGVVTYRVRVRLEKGTEATVRPGMTVSVRIITQRVDGALIVPRRAVRIENGQAYVQRVLPGGRLENTPVTLGLADSFNIQVVSGLAEGDQVFVPSVVQRNAIQQLFQGGSTRVRPQ